MIKIEQNLAQQSLVHRFNLCGDVWAVFVFVLFLVPLPSFAQVEITEIMYNLEGSDSGREWIEICNAGAESVDTTGWKFFENGSNHGLALISGSEAISSGETAVIVSDSAKFLADWPSFSGNLYDSSFSLSNTGELLEIRNAELVAQDSVTYTSDWGADGDGKTLNKVDGSFAPETATPGSASCLANSFVSSGQSSGDGIWIDTNENIWVSAGDDRVIVVGQEVELESYAEGVIGEELEAEKYIWNFGDGATGEGASVLHTYSYPGTYIAVLNIVSGKLAASDRLDVVVVPADIFVTAHVSGEDGYVEVTNDTLYELNISGWFLLSGNEEFQFPEGSIVSNLSPIRFVNKITGLDSGEGEAVELRFPNGVVANTYNSIQKNIHTGIQNQQQKRQNNLPKQSLSPFETQSQKVINGGLRGSTGGSNSSNGFEGSNDSANSDSLDDVIYSDFQEEFGDADNKYLQDAAVTAFSLDEGDFESKTETQTFDYSLLKWLVSLLVLIAGASVAVIIVREEDDNILLSPDEDIRIIAEEIEILEQ